MLGWHENIIEQKLTDIITTQMTQGQLATVECIPPTELRLTVTSGCLQLDGCEIIKLLRNLKFANIVTYLGGP